MRLLARMFGGLFHTLDTKRTVNAVGRLDLKTQKAIARWYVAEIHYVMADIAMRKNSEFPTAEQELVEAHIYHALELRHLALAAGAKTRSHPAWAAASLLESWITGQFALSQSAANRIDHTIMRWVQSALSRGEIEIAMREGIERIAPRPKSS